MKKRKLKKQGWILLVGILVFSMVIFFTFFSKKKVTMKDLSSLGESEIKVYANKQKLNLILEREYHDTISEGHVIRQSIDVGQKLEKGDSLTVVLSLGAIDLDTYQELGVNEMGKVPIMMYHGIHNLKNEETAYTGGNVDRDGYQRTVEAFRADLEMFYQKGYRMISLKNYVNGVIDVPLGKSPIILTFDDGLTNNIRVTGLDEKGNIIIDPNSAIGVLEEFKKKYPDFGVTATFFINGGLFEQPEYNEKILNYLTSHGYDVGNHTYSHPDFTKISYEKSVTEVGKMYALLERYLKGEYVPIVALPFGLPYKKSHENFSAILSGTYEGMSYQTVATLQVGWESNFSPFSKNFDPQFLKRIRAYDNDGKDFDIAYCFKQLESSRYISDGNVNQVTVPKEDQIYLQDKITQKVVTY